MKDVLQYLYLLKLRSVLPTIHVFALSFLTINIEVILGRLYLCILV